MNFGKWRFKRPNLWLFAIEMALTTGIEPAHALPVAFVAGLIGASATSFAAIAVTAIINIGLTLAASALINAIVGTPKQQRQAQITTLAIGETPRMAIFGTAAVGGTLCDAFNWGGQYGTDWECVIIALADHKCAGLDHFYVNDQKIAYPAGGFANGYVPDQTVTGQQMVGGQLVTTTGTVRYNNQLQVWFLDGSAVQTLPGVVGNGGWSTTGNFDGICLAVVAYKADDPSASNPVWSGGRPSFLFAVKGKLCYDPRKDSTVGGSGAHRWADPTTWEWTDNAAVCRYNWTRGIYAKDQVSDPTALLMGRGLSSLEAPEANVFAYANLCDEQVALRLGGSEARYRVGGVIKSDQTFVEVDQMFADAMGGIIIQPGGSVEVEPGHARTPTFSITDDDLITGSQVTVSNFRSEADDAWVNTVIPRYVEPSQKWQDHAAPVRRAIDTVVSDGGPRNKPLALTLVTSGTQAQRVGEIQRRLGELLQTATITLGPRFSGIEEGDWGIWTSQRHFAGQAVMFRVDAYRVDNKRQITLTLREITTQVFDWVAATDEFISDIDMIRQGAPDQGWTGYGAVGGYLNDPLIANSYVSLRSDGTLLGAGGGQVTIGGLGYTGDLNATSGAPSGTSVGSSTADAVATAVTTTIPALVSDTNLNANTLLAYAYDQQQLRDYVDGKLFVAGVPVNTAITNEQSQRQTADAALAQTIALIGAVNGTSNAFILNADSVQVSSTGATLSSTIQTLNAATANASASITNLQTLLTTATGGAKATAVFQLDANNHVVGYQATNDGSTGAMVFSFDSFTLLNPATNTSMFTAAGGVVKMPSVQIDTLKVGTAVQPVRVSQTTTVTGTNGTIAQANLQTIMTVTITMPTPGWIEVNAVSKQNFPSGSDNWYFGIAVNGSLLPESYSWGGTFEDVVASQGSYYAASAGTYTVSLMWNGGGNANLINRSMFAKGYPGARGYQTAHGGVKPLPFPIWIRMIPRFLRPSTIRAPAFQGGLGLPQFARRFRR